MILPGESSKLGGLAFLLTGSAWLAIGLPRVVRTAQRPFIPLVLATLGSLLLPVIYPLIHWLWRVATPSKLTVWFTVAWVACWVASLVAALALPCPSCGRAFNRSRTRFRVAPFDCVSCGAGPSDRRAHQEIGREPPDAGLD